jgi:hypothetical protein
MSESTAAQIAQAAPPPASFWFNLFADSTAAQAAFEAAYPPGSPIASVLQMLVDRGAQCRTVGPAKVACRYLDEGTSLVCLSWHAVLESNSEGAVRRVSIGLAIVGP